MSESTTTKTPFTIPPVAGPSAVPPTQIIPMLFELGKASYEPAVVFASRLEDETGARTGVEIPAEELPALIAELSRLDAEFRQANGSLHALTEAGWILS